MRAAFDRIRRGQWTDPVEWNGSFHAIIYWIPERDRAFRDQLRTMTMRGGYATLRPGLLINPRDAFGELHRMISAAPPEAYVVRAKVELSIDDARETARRAWSLDGLGNEYRAVTRTLTEAVDRAPRLKPIAGTVFDYHAHLRRLTHLQLHDPGLPSQLLPTDWPVEDVFQARRAFIESWGHVVATYVYQTIIETGTLEIAQFDQTVASSQYAFLYRSTGKPPVDGAPRSELRSRQS
ncbi:MAG: PaaX family transcriptional regulator C-terminal domain-containing protein [Antricoccus sp.]